MVQDRKYQVADREAVTSEQGEIIHFKAGKETEVFTKEQGLRGIWLS